MTICGAKDPASRLANIYVLLNFLTHLQETINVIRKLK
ncbi:hypothetical protein BMETH_1833_0 [methanotrophic bacterial endosymbiont of Bathymodiolus sp.]|nr:hypothetical protein BMETH_1833_0 [methanotrophic bacterial endosymbiont of Bathymodiolus sp.]